MIRYFVVHNSVCNGDSYTGTMIHIYYLYEEDGRLSMLPWDYNLAYGTFQPSDATETVNTPIDTPVSGGASEDRPMVGWIFGSEESTQLYHRYFAEFLETTDFAVLIDATAALIAPYIEKDPTRFYGYEAFETGVAALKEFCLLREESILGQLDGTIPSTTDGQLSDPSALIDAARLSLSAMGSMGGGMPGEHGAMPALKPTAPGGTAPQLPAAPVPDDFPSAAPPDDAQPAEAGQPAANAGRPPQTALENMAQISDGQAETSLLIVGLSAAVLMAGLFMAFLFKRR